MSTIGGSGGPGGIGGPKGPGAIDDLREVGEVGEVGDVGEVDAAGPSRGAAASEGAAVARAHGAGDLDAISADIAAGRLSPQEAIDRLVEATAGPDLGAAERAELRDLLTDLVANDPHLGRLLAGV